MQVCLERVVAKNSVEVKWEAVKLGGRKVSGLEFTFVPSRQETCSDMLLHVRLTGNLSELTRAKICSRRRLFAYLPMYSYTDS